MSIINNWLRDVEELESYSNDLMYKVNVRNQHAPNSIQFSRMGSQVTVMLKTLKERIGLLKENLNVDASNLVITSHEADRRQRLLDGLNTKCKQIENNINNPGSYSRNSLLGGSNLTPSASRGTGLSNDRDDDPANEFNPTEYRQTHLQLRREQDRGLDVLGDIITRQQTLARGIGQEIDVQNEIIDDIGDGMDNTNQRLIRNTRNIKKISFKSESCCYWIVIILLFVAIMVVAFI